MFIVSALSGVAQQGKSSAGKKVVLNWSTSVDDQYSHFVIERSLDNTAFSEVGYLFTGEDESTGFKKSYSFSDDVKNVPKGFVYYRINMVDMKGKVQKSIKHTVYTVDHKATPVVKVSPNPVVSDLKVSLPAEWKGKFVSLEVINNLNGQPVRTELRQEAALNETLALNDLAEGIYILRVSNGTDTIIQRIIKSK